MMPSTAGFASALTATLSSQHQLPSRWRKRYSKRLQLGLRVLAAGEDAAESFAHRLRIVGMQELGGVAA